MKRLEMWMKRDREKRIPKGEYPERGRWIQRQRKGRGGGCGAPARSMQSRGN